MSTAVAPILLLIYRRLDTALRVLDSIRATKPSRIYIAANAPASNDTDECEQVKRARSIVDRIDWPCEKITLFREEHLKVRESIPSSISWFMQHESEGIILEDDCVVSPDFICFASEMLVKYRDDDRVVQISASNVQGETAALDGDYFFSKFPQIWGWATWAKSWRKMDLTGSKSHRPAIMRLLKDWFPNPWVRVYWLLSYYYTCSGRRDTWDSLWTLSVWLRKGLTIVPRVNLVSNIGFGGGSTNTAAAGSRWAAMRVRPFPKPWKSPRSVVCSEVPDDFILNEFYGHGRPWPLNVARMLIALSTPLAMKRWIKKHIG